MRTCRACQKTGGGLDGAFVNGNWYCSEACQPTHFAPARAPRLAPTPANPTGFSLFTQMVIAKARRGNKAAIRHLETAVALALEDEMPPFVEQLVLLRLTTVEDLLGICIRLRLHEDYDLRDYHLGQSVVEIADAYFTLVQRQMNLNELYRVAGNIQSAFRNDGKLYRRIVIRRIQRPPDFFDELPNWMSMHLDEMERKTGDSLDREVALQFGRLPQ